MESRNLTEEEIQAIESMIKLKIQQRLPLKRSVVVDISSSGFVLWPNRNMREIV